MTFDKGRQHPVAFYWVLIGEFIMHVLLLGPLLFIGACSTIPAARTHIVPAGWESS